MLFVVGIININTETKLEMEKSLNTNTLIPELLDKVGEASKVAPIDKLSVVLVAVFAVAFLGERPSIRDWTGIIMVAGGVLVLALKR